MERQLHLIDNSEYCKGSSGSGFAWLIDPVAIDRNLWDNYKVDYGDEVHAFAMETRISVHRNLYHGHQSTDRKV